MECLIQAIVEIVLGLLGEILAGLFSAGTATSYVKTRPNLHDRRDAVKHGDKPPPHDRWFWAFVILLPITVMLIVLMVVKWSKPR